MEVGERRSAREGAVQATADPIEPASLLAPADRSGADAYPASPAIVSMERSRRRYALRRALVELAAPGSDAATGEIRAATAAHAAVALAEIGDGDGLATILRPDPAVDPAAWTVACYEIGHLTPTSLRDLSDPAEAVQLVVGCPEVSHIAAELVVSTSAGLRWTALVRAGSVLRLRLPSESNASGESHVAGELASTASDRWQDQLTAWSTEPEPAVDAVWAPAAARSLEAAVASALEAAATVHAAEMAAAAIRHAAELDAAETRHAAAIEEARLAGAALALASAPAPEVAGRRLGTLWASVAAESRVPPVVRRWIRPATPVRVPASCPPTRYAPDVHQPHA